MKKIRLWIFGSMKNVPSEWKAYCDGFESGFVVLIIGLIAIMILTAILGLCIK